MVIVTQTCVNNDELEKDNSFRSDIERNNKLSELVALLISDGYLTAGIDSTVIKGDTLLAYLFCGAKYEWASLHVDSCNSDLLLKTGFKNKQFNDKQFSPKQLQLFYEKIIQYYENNGHPFARVWLENTDIDSNKITAELMVNPESFIIIDSVVIKGDVQISKNFLYQYIGVFPGNEYNEQVISKIGERLRQLTFIKISKEPEISFHGEKATLYLYLNEKKSSDVNGILGILPNPITGKITFTGDAHLGLKNALKNGELMELRWRALQSLTQDMKVQVNFPFLFKSPFGTDVGIKLYKKDTTYISVNQKIAILYHLTGNRFVHAFVFNSSSNLTANNTNITVLPDYADVKTWSYGLGITTNNLNNIFNPRSGIIISFEASAGNKKITINPDLNEQIYDGINLNSQEYKVFGVFDFFIPIKQRSTIKLFVSGGSILNENIFDNELFKFGGFNDLRGFDEEYFLASSYSIGTLEYRFLFEENANFHVFTDIAWYEKNSVNSFITDTPISAGIGVSFETGAGIFSLNYALGREFNNPVLLKAAKIHFGFVALF